MSCCCIKLPILTYRSVSELGLTVAHLMDVGWVGFVIDLIYLESWRRYGGSSDREEMLNMMVVLLISTFRCCCCDGSIYQIVSRLKMNWLLLVVVVMVFCWLSIVDVGELDEGL